MRVLDFGLARADTNLADPAKPDALDDPLALEAGPWDSLETPVTRAGSLLGTPAYMPPEQLAGAATDPRADIYAFCASLWEAVHGARPYTGQTPADLIAAIHGQRPLDAGRPVPRWLRAVLLRGLAPDPDDRWPTMDALVAALADAAGRRRRRLAALAAAAGLAVAAAALALVRAERGRREADCEDRGAAIAAEWNDDARARVRAALFAPGQPHALHTADRVRDALDLYAKTWSEAQVESCRHATVARDWDADAAARADACLDERRWTLAGLVGVLAEPDAGAATRAVEAAASLPPIDPCLDVDTLARRPGLPTDPEVRARAAKLQADLGRALSLGAAGRYADGLALAEQLVAPADALGWPPLAAEVRLAAGNLASAIRRTDNQAEHTLEAAFFLALDAGHDVLAARAAVRLSEYVGSTLLRLDDAERWSRLARALLPRLAGEAPLVESLLLCSDANLAKMRGDPTTAAATFARCHEARAALLGPAHPLTAAALFNHASVGAGVSVRQRRDLLARALAAQEPALGPEHPIVAKTLGDLGNLQIQLGELDAADAALTRAIELDRRHFGPDHVRVGDDHLRLARLERARGRLEAAREHYAATLARFESGPPNARAMAIEALFEIAEVERDLGDLDAALAHAELAHTRFSGHLGDDHIGTVPGLVNLAVVRSARREHDLAAPLIARARGLMTGSDNTDLIVPYVHLGDLARAAGDLAQAEADYDRAAAIAGRVDDDPRALGLPLLRRGELRLARGDLDAALADLTAAREHLERPGPPHDRGAARFALARALAARGEHARARELAALALADDGGLRDDARAEVRRWLDGVSPASPR